MRFWLLIKEWLYSLLPERKKVIPNPEAKQGGVTKQPSDERDYSPKPSTSPIPDSYTLRPLVSRVENQGIYNSCVAHAITTAVETLMNKTEWPHYFELSRMHSWNSAKKLTWGSPKWKENLGCYIRDGWKSAQKPGLTIEKLFPYTPSNDGKTLHKSWLWRWHPRFEYKFIKGFTDDKKLRLIKQAISEGNAVVFGIRVGPDFQRLRFHDRYVPDGKATFAHAMVIIGYDDSKDTFEIMNSWGRRWGINGRAYVSQEWIIKEAFDISYCEAI